MSEIILNKQVNVWRGPSEPPTIYHVWIYDNRLLKLHNGTEWVTFLDNPGLVLREIGKTIRVSVGETYFDIVSQGNSLTITRRDNTIIFQSNALSTIPTDDYLKWEGNKLYHKEILEEITRFGPVTNTNSNEFTVPSILVDKAGHVIGGESMTVSIPDKVVQNPLNTDQSAEYDVILAGSTSHERASGEVNKDQDLKLSIEKSGNTVSKVLKTPGIDASGNVNIDGNVVVKDGYTIRGTVIGNVTGTATPTNHADATDKFGLGTSPGIGPDGGVIPPMYGHVKLQDELPLSEPPAGYTLAGKGIASTPRMVYNAMIKCNEYADGLFGSDFKKDGGTYNITWLEI